MHELVLTLTALAFMGPVSPTPTAKLSGPKAVEVGDPILLNAVGSSAPGGVEFALAQGPGDAAIVTLHSDDGQTTVGLATCTTAGTYQFVVIAWGAQQGGAPGGTHGAAPPPQQHAFAFWTVQVGQPPPPPPPPGDPLTATLQAAYAKDVDAGKADLVARLVKVYRDAVAPPGLVNSGAYATVGDLLTAYVAARQKAGVPDSALINLRTAVAAEFKKTLNYDPSAKLDAATRGKFAEQFSRVASILEAIK